MIEKAVAAAVTAQAVQAMVNESSVPPDRPLDYYAPDLRLLAQRKYRPRFFFSKGTDADASLRPSRPGRQPDQHLPIRLRHRRL